MTETLPSSTRDRKAVRWLVVGLLVFFGGLYLVGYFVTGDRIPRGTTIEGIDVGGRSVSSAVTALEVMPGLDRSVTLQAGKREVVLRPSELGLSLDAQASVDQVSVGRSFDPRDMWAFVTGGDDYDAVVRVDDGLLTDVLEELAAEFDGSVREASIAFTEDGRPEPTYPRAGRGIDVDNARTLVADAYPRATDEPLELPIEEITPQVTREDVSAALRDFANPAMSAPVTLRIAGQSVVVQPAEYAPALSMETVDGALQPRLKNKVLLGVIAPKMSTINLSPTDATVAIVDGTPQVVPGEDGLTFKAASITGTFLDVVARDKNRTLQVKTRLATPEFSAAEVRELGIKEVVGEFTTNFPYAEYRNINIGRAAELINGTVLMPGEVFSLNGIVGERTAENGFVKGFIISDGIFRQDLGGGVSQVATTAFNAAFFAGLEDVEHKPHSFYISRYPVGREATVAWPTVDLKFKNDTEYGVLVQAFRVNSTPTSEGSMNVRLWSTKVWDIKARESERYNFTSPSTRRIAGPDCEPNEGYGGFDIDVFRDFYRPGSSEKVRTETFNTTYTPSDTVICTG